MGATLLIVEDEPAILDFLADNLQQDEHRVVRAGTMVAAAAGLVRERPEIALIDVGLPDGSGFDLCRRIREGELGDPDLGIIMLTARAEEQDRVRGFQRGADDYVTKPFHYPELLLRVQALAARLRGRRGGERIVVGDVAIDTLERRVTVAGRPLHLPAKEFDLLAVLARDPLRVFTKPDLLDRVWGYRDASTTRTLDSHASRLRRRLEGALPGERFVVNHWGHGYALRGAPR
jgi:two-component system phosphate regulon response regulator PhoB